MSFSNSGLISIRNNLRMISRVSYFRNRGREINRDKRTGTGLKKIEVSKNAYALSQERKALMFEKDKTNFKIFFFIVIITSSLTVWFLG